MELISTQGSVLKWQDDDSDFPVPCLNIPANNNDSCVNQELQNLCKMFTSWLQPETHSKEQIISQLVMEQFLKTAHCKDKIAVKMKWDTSGKNMRRFMQEITDECLKPPEMIHVSMHGEEGLFPGHMTLNEVINILNGMKSSTTSARTDLRIPLNILSPTRECEEVEQRSVVGQKPLLMPTFMDCPFSTGHEDSENGYNNPMNLSKVNRRERSPGIEMDSISIIQTHRCLQTEEKDVSDVIPQDYRSSNQLTSMYHGFSQREASFEVVPKEEVQQDIMVPVEQLQSEMITRPQQNEDCQNSERDYTCESHQERQNRVPKTYQCEECPRTFKCPSSLLSHQRRHKKERTFVCNTCHKDFYNKSDLNVHSVIHKGKKPFACNTCGQSFSHKTNLIAHERIHTGEKPYTCSLCNHSFRQSSTYHRHRRLCHKSE